MDADKLDLLEPSVSALIEKMMDAHGEKAVYRTFAKMGGYEDAPPTINEFIDDSEFLGNMLGKDQQTGQERIYPYWRSCLNEVYPNPFNSPYMEVVATGAIGQGKSTFSMVGVMYDIMKLLHVKDPHQKYSILSSDQIVLTLMNSTMGAANDVLMKQILSWIESSPYFTRHKRKTRVGSIFEKRIHIQAGSRATHFLGKAVFSSILSEINFQKTMVNQAAENYNGVRQRIRSRFQSKHVYPGRMWIDSSKTDSGSFIDDVLLKDREEEDLKQIKIYDNPRWVVLPPWKLGDISETFKVFVGSENRDPFIVERPDQIIGIDESRVMDVPEMFRSDFNLNLYKALQDVAGVSTQAKLKFINSSEKIEQSFTHENPVFQVQISTDYYDKSDRLIDYIDFSKIIEDRRPRFVHIDLGYADGGDSTGIAFTRLDGIISSSRHEPMTNKITQINDPVFHTDFVMCIAARPGQEQPIHKIRDLMVDLRSRKYPVTMITADSFQSKYLLQQLELEGFKTDGLSVDTSFEPYIELKNAILQGRWHGPKHPILDEEIRKLEISSKKIDHPKNASKDVADAVAGSVYSAKINMNTYWANGTANDLIAALRSSEGPTSIYDQIASNRVFLK